jgi:hypothetical protein
MMNIIYRYVQAKMSERERKKGREFRVFKKQ